MHIPTCTTWYLHAWKRKPGLSWAARTFGFECCAAIPPSRSDLFFPQPALPLCTLPSIYDPPPHSTALTPSCRPSISALINLPSRCRPHSRYWTSQLFLSPLTTPSLALSAPSCSLHRSCIQLTHCQSGLLSPLRPPTQDINLYQLSTLSKLDKRQATLFALCLCPHVFCLPSLSLFFLLQLSSWPYNLPPAPTVKWYSFTGTTYQSSL